MPTLQPTENTQRPLPVWFSIPIILVCLLGGGWIIHWYVISDPLSHEAKILGDAPTQAQWQGWPGNGNGRGRNGGPGGGGPGGNPNQRRFVRDQGDGRIEIRTDQARVNVSLNNGKLNWHTITYMSYPFVADNIKNTIYSARAIVADNNRLTTLKITPDQAKKLRALSNTITMNISEADKIQFGTEVDAFIKTPEAQRNALEPALLKMLDDIAQKSIPATRQQAIDRATQINAIITPAQWKQDAAMGGPGGGPGK